jgi:hypothetical protein
MDSTSSILRTRIDAAPARSFLRVESLASGLASKNAVDTALSRLTDDPQVPLVRVRRGLYWRGTLSKFGKGGPSPAQVVLAVAGDRGGIGPAGWSASRDLGLTTQRPAIEEFATIAPAPTGISGVHFQRRSNPRRADLRYLEIAALEVVRAWPAYVDGSWADVARAICSRVKSGEVRESALKDAARFESASTRERLESLLSAA